MPVRLRPERPVTHVGRANTAEYQQLRQPPSEPEPQPEPGQEPRLDADYGSQSIPFVRCFAGQHDDRVKKCCAFQVSSTQYEKLMEVSEDLPGHITAQEAKLTVGDVLKSTKQSGMWMVLSCADDCVLKLWDMHTGKCVRRFGKPGQPRRRAKEEKPSHDGWIRDCCVYYEDADGKNSKGENSKGHWMAVSASTDRCLRVWNLSTGKLRLSWPSDSDSEPEYAHENWIMSCNVYRCTPRSDWMLVSCSSDNTIKRWNLSTGKLDDADLTAHDAAHDAQENLMGCCIFDQGTDRDETAEPQGAELEQQFTARLTLGNPAAISWGRDYKLQIWDLSNGKPAEKTCTLEGHNDWVSCCSVLHASDKLWILSGSDDHTLKLWERELYNESSLKQKTQGQDSGETDKILCSSTLLGHSAQVVGCSVFSVQSESKEKRALSCSLDQTLRVWDLDKEMPFAPCLRTLECSAPVRGCCVYSTAAVHIGLSCLGEGQRRPGKILAWNLSHVIAESGSRYVRKGQAIDQSEARQLELQEKDPAGLLVGTTTGAASLIQGGGGLQDTNKLMTVAKARRAGVPIEGADSSLFRAYCGPGCEKPRTATRNFWQVYRHTLPVHLNASQKVESLWSLEYGGKIYALQTGGLLGVHFFEAKEKTMVLTCGDDKLVKLWDLDPPYKQYENEQTPVWTARGHEKAVVSCTALSALDRTSDSEPEPPKTHAMSLSTDGTLRMWDLKSGAEVVAVRQNVAEALESDLQNLRLRAAVSSYVDGKLPVEVARPDGSVAAILDCSHVLASVTLRQSIESFRSLVEHTLRTGWNDQAGCLMSPAEILEAVLAWADSVVAAREASPPCTMITCTGNHDRLRTEVQTFMSKVSIQGNNDARYAKAVLCVLEALAKCSTHFRQSNKDADARMLSWASIILTLSIRKDTLKGKVENPAKSESLLDCAAKCGSWIGTLLLPMDDPEVDCEIEIAFLDRGRKKILIKRFLDAFQTLQTDKTFCLAETMNELLPAAGIARLLNPKLDVVSIAEHFIQQLDLRPLRQHHKGSAWNVVRNDNLVVQTLQNRSSHNGPFITSSTLAWGPVRQKGTSCRDLLRFVDVWDIGWAFQKNKTEFNRAVTHSVVPLCGTRKEWFMLVHEIVQSVGENPHIFRGQALRVVVNCLWSSGSQKMYLILVFLNVLNLLAFAWLATIDDTHILLMPVAVLVSDDHANMSSSSAWLNITAEQSWNIWTRPSTWWVQTLWLWCFLHAVIACIFQGLVTKNKWNGVVCDRSPPGTMRRAWEWVLVMTDWVHLILTIASLALMLLWRDNVQQHDVDAVQAWTIFCLSLHFLHYLRGFDRTAFLMNMLERILRDMIPFTCVLTFIITMFALVFWLLCRHSDIDYQVRNDLGHVFNTPGAGWVTTFNMALGDFDVEYFRRAPYPFWTTGVFVTFMFIVPIIFLNALIAIMSNSYEQVKEETDERCTLERAQLLLELETMRSCACNEKIENRDTRLRDLCGHVWACVDFSMDKYVHVIAASGDEDDIDVESYEQAENDQKTASKTDVAAIECKIEQVLDRTASKTDVAATEDKIEQVLHLLQEIRTMD